MKTKPTTLVILVLFVLLHLLGISIQAQTWTVPIYGCIQGRSSTAVINNPAILVRTGEPALDADIQDDITELNNLFKVNVPVYFPNDRLESAFFTAYKFPELIIKDDGDPRQAFTGSVFISISFLKREWRENRGNLMSVPGILGHEYAHAMQFNKKFPYGGKWKELHADFLAGWFVAHRTRFRLTDPEVSFRSFYKKGDIGFFARDPHGTSEERVLAMSAGYNFNFWANNGSAEHAYMEGLRYIQHLGAR